MGNHDDREAMRSVFGDCDWLPDEGFVQYVVDLGGLRLIALDTHVPGAPGGTLCDDRLDWLNDRLSEAPDRPTILFLRHPSFSTYDISFRVHSDTLAHFQGELHDGAGMATATLATAGNTVFSFGGWDNPTAFHEEAILTPGEYRLLVVADKGSRVVDYPRPPRVASES